MAGEDSTIDGFQVVGDIAASGTSHVLDVLEAGTQRHLAMKLLNKEHPDFKENKASLKYEAQVCKSLDHPNIIKYEGYSSSRDHTYMVMEYFRAPNLKMQIMQDRNGVHLKLKKLLDGLCAALQHIHDKGYIHRDIKPENVLVNKAGEVRLIDFSLALKQKGALAKLFSGKQQIQGTRTYIAPETIRKRAPTIQTDLYSLGVLIFEMLAGKTPFQAPTPNELLQKHLTTEPPLPSEFNKNVSPEMDNLVFKLLSKKPDKRGKDIIEISGELRRINFFKEEPKEKFVDVGGELKKADLLSTLTSGVLDSRADAEWSDMVKENPELAHKMVAKQAERKADKAAEKARREARIEKSNRSDAAKAATSKLPQTPVAPPMGPPMMMPQPMYPPGYGPAPGMPMPMGPPPGYPPGMMMPGMPPGYPPGAMMPGMPMMPGYPPMPVAPGMPPAPVPQPPAPKLTAPVAAAAPPPAAPIAATPRPAPPPPPPVPANAEELDYMTELPDVL